MAKPRCIKDKILELKGQGKSYNIIMKELNCSKGTVAYHLGLGQINKSANRQRTRRNSDKLIQKIERFHNDRPLKSNLPNSSLKVQKIIYLKWHRFHRGDISMANFTSEDLRKKIGDNPVCYSTGRAIDLTKSREYHLDHIIPVSKGGKNTLDNCGITCRDANQSKTDLSLEDYIKLCKEVIAQYEKKGCKSTNT